jgi:hypothetical protein
MGSFYALSRGNKYEVDEFIKQLSCQYLPFEWINPKTKLFEKVQMQMSVRPVQLWEFSFPEPMRDAVINTILKGYDGKTQFSAHEMMLKMIRKGLGVNTLNPYDKTKALPPIVMNNTIAWYPIGEKEDNWLDKDGNIKKKGDEGTYEGL